MFQKTGHFYNCNIFESHGSITLNFSTLKTCFSTTYSIISENQLTRFHDNQKVNKVQLKNLGTFNDLLVFILVKWIGFILLLVTSLSIPGPNLAQDITTQMESPTHVDDPSVFLQNDCWSHVRRPSVHSSISIHTNHHKNKNNFESTEHIRKSQQKYI